ncbi:MAG: acetoin dehydrogenase [Candidatus Schekmanbacteria bacterium RIFCSPHIGHO2_02_FULL_38_11]|uniref:Acetoin dehydrogenase n=1 Tax=Candidatus Schekmanbacteria bacterium RIFCSPLOWO2_12_FULL_38_15 TaxID=1817883 RepID=A0A1F7SJK9_9BACT|nr:MAG: acetoin dehydrogenase [Candidatus Schekmanbacteria bacterium GWA2_38_9]OGL50486.1 MAG: acetoin dehydrogenase [Candidatus Schekmanbacteria bacterium RIFCSPLOWO2_02_FULL_38_14]OGL53945.1 MAG: acetoin dehydrogenase [Candidatus Schekmanbacteria bacterium RIFCSPLOWO2_12_FULL_38_15]OGL54126.1 MAG: acetoin dehydrogenase [Candidatus Schekmanbacteria bacterium RIFCSPHIGHO2_02_FULL_38_11]
MIIKEKKLELYYNMLKIRMVEETIVELYPEQQMRCPVHLCSGQEAIAAGVCANLRKEDYVMSNHRSHGHFLAKGGSLRAMMAEILGKATGCTKGKGGSMHLVDLEVNYLGSTPIVGGIIPVAVGVAFGTVMKGENRVTVVFLGDAATEEGVFCESLNFAALKKLPVVFVCENNFYSVYSPLSVRQPEERDNLSIARAFGIYSEKGDGNDVEVVDHIAGKAIEHARKCLGPSFIEFDTYRFREHCGPNYDNNLGYRSEEEFMEWYQKCPVENFEKRLLQEGILLQQQIKEFRQKIRSEIDAAINFAKESPFPEINQIYSDVYAGDELR